MVQEPVAKVYRSCKKRKWKGTYRRTEWFTMGDMDIASCPSDVLSYDQEFGYSTSDEESQLVQFDEQNTSDQDRAEEADNSLDDSTSSGASSSSGGTKKNESFSSSKENKQSSIVSMS